MVTGNEGNRIVKAVDSKTLPYGTWPSVLSAKVVTSAGSSFGMPAEYAGSVLATEMRPEESGRVALVERQQSGVVRDVLPRDYSVRTRVHEYGGRAWWSGLNHVYFCCWEDQRLYSAKGSPDALEAPCPLTPEPLAHHGLRFADGIETPDGQWVIAVAEVHTSDQARLGLTCRKPDEAVNVVIAIPTDGSAVNDATRLVVLSRATDFVSNPRVSADGTRLCWLQWNHPNMPWDATELMTAHLALSPKPVLSHVQCIAGGTDLAIVGPSWLRDGRLAYSTDESGWWNVSVFNPETKTHQSVTQLTNAEIGAPAWGIGTSRFTELCNDYQADGEDLPWLAVAVTESAEDWLGVVRVSGSMERLPVACAAVKGLSATADGGLLVHLDLADADSEHRRFTQEELAKSGCGKALFNPKATGVTPGFRCSIAESFWFDSAGETAQAFFYPPAAQALTAPDGEKPPLIVMGHGGPTAHASPSLRMGIQYWTSRGFAVADVNYRGSSGFGRGYRQGLNEAWGVVDVEDCINVVKALSEQGKVDPNRCVIRGGSAGGLTVLRALQTSDVFAAGTSLYGVADLEALLADTHKFESRYLDTLIGPYPEEAERYRLRSPIHHASDITSPLLVLQGDEDKVVPPSQSTSIVAAVAAQSLPHAYVLFEGEQHGWRKASTLVRALELELWFYGAVLGFVPDDDIAAPEEAVGF
jgi:dipeptidyl aminopeptidase/acylaminoacyl peptidase